MESRTGRSSRKNLREKVRGKQIDYLDFCTKILRTKLCTNDDPENLGVLSSSPLCTAYSTRNGFWVVLVCQRSSAITRCTWAIRSDVAGCDRKYPSRP